MNLDNAEYPIEVKQRLGADFTFIYDDQSYDAPDLQTGMPRDDAKHIALIRTRFKSAAMEALGMLKRHRFVHTNMAGRRQVHPLRLMSLTDFMKQKLATPGRPYVGLPVLIVAVAFQYVELREDRKSVRAVYHSPSVVEMVARINQQLRHGYQYTANELAAAPSDSALEHAEIFELFPGPFRDIPEKLMHDMQFNVVVTRNDIHKHLPRNHMTHRIFVHVDDEGFHEHNDFEIDSVVYYTMKYAQENLFKDRDIQSSAALQEIITQGLAGESRPEWSQFLTRGLYHPWLFVLINYFLEPRKRE